MAETTDGDNTRPIETEAVETDQDAERLNGDSVGLQDLSTWRGRSVIDVNGESVGRLEEVYFDIDTDEPQFGVVTQGSLFHHRRLVPLAGALAGPDGIQIRATQQEVKDAPTIDPASGDLTTENESALYHYYRLNYVASDRESGRRLIRH